MDLSRLDSRLRERQILVACDVTNPLVGPSGAAAVFGPQKGASPHEVRLLDRGLKNLARLWKALGRGDLARRPGAGAAGGLAAGLVAFCGARIVPGIEVVLNAVGFERLIHDADLVVTGEGALNAQSLSGKVVSGVASRCRAAGVPVVVVAGSVADAPPAETLHALGIAGVFPIVDGPITEAEAMRDAARLVECRAGWVARLFLAAHESWGKPPRWTRESIE